MTVSIFGGAAAAADYPPVTAEASPGSLSTPYFSSGASGIGGVSVTPGGGKPGYSYSWQSDNGEVYFDDASAASCNAYINTTFPAEYMGNIWCVVTDSRGRAAATDGIPFTLYPDA